MKANRFNFRAWDGTRMIQPEELEMYPHKNIKRLGHPLMQSTGLTDKNGIEIFEGDFLSFEDDPVDVIMWNVDYSCWIAADESAQCRDGYINWDTAHIQKDHTKYYIVQGNIYENPDMLGGKS